jgi:purine-binding chemotaxis protein CheW
MGRMSSARKKSQKKAGEQPVAEPVQAEIHETPVSHPVPDTEEVAAVTKAVSQRPRKGRETKIALPSSGLAEDILAREDTRAVEFSAIEAASTPPAPAIEPARAQNIAFFATHSREEQKPAEAMEHLVTFFLGDEEYGLDVRIVQEIIRVLDTTPVPRAPVHVKGVINLRGHIIPVVDLKLKLRLGEVDIKSRNARIVVTKTLDRFIGLLVDGASQVLKVPVSLVDAAPEEIVEIDADYIRGVAKLENRLIILMNLDNILSMEPRTPMSISSSE